MATLLKESYKDLDFCLDPSLVLYTPLHASDGAFFRSRDRYGRLCNANGSTWVINGRLFNGVSNAITGSDANFPTGVQERTILMWVNLSVLKDYQCFFYYGTEAPNQSFTLLTSNGADNNKLMAAAFGNNAVVHITDILVVNQWHFIGVEMNTAGSVRYIFDEHFSAADVPFGGGPPNTVLNTFKIGRWANANDWLNGIANETWFYNRRLSHPEALHIRSYTKWRYS